MNYSPNINHINHKNHKNNNHINHINHKNINHINDSLRNGFMTYVWGPPLWHFLHTISFNFPLDYDSPASHELAIKYKLFLLSLVHILPCKYCRENLKKNFKKLPLTNKHLKSREAFSRYVYDLHELVNHMLHKKSNLTYEQVKERYEHFRSKCTSKTSKKSKSKDKVDNISKSKKHKKEKGCTKSLHGTRSRCILNIVPINKKGKSLQIDKTLYKTLKKQKQN